MWAVIWEIFTKHSVSEEETIQEETILAKSPRLVLTTTVPSGLTHVAKTVRKDLRGSKNK